MSLRVCIVIPMYNEERLARQSLETILGFVKELPPGVMLAVVDDGSKDRTRVLIEESRALAPDLVTVIAHERNRGYGAALRSGIAFAVTHKFDYCLFMDSDLTNHPVYLRAFYDRMLEGAEYIKATRYGKGAGVRGVPWHRRLVSAAGNCVARLLCGLPLHDLTNGFRAVKTSVLARLALREPGFPVIMEELFLAKPLVRSYAEVAYVLTSRQEGQGTTHFSYNLRTYAGYLRYALKAACVRRPAA